MLLPIKIEDTRSGVRVARRNIDFFIVPKPRRSMPGTFSRGSFQDSDL
jgi:hypothetical protein